MPSRHEMGFILDNYNPLMKHFPFKRVSETRYSQSKDFGLGSFKLEIYIRTLKQIGEGRAIVITSPSNVLKSLQRGDYSKTMLMLNNQKFILPTISTNAYCKIINFRRGFNFVIFVGE